MMITCAHIRLACRKVILSQKRGNVHCWFPTQSRCYVQIAKRQFLPGSEGPNFPELLKPPRDNFPKILRPTDFGNSPVSVDDDELKKLGIKTRPIIEKVIEDHPAVLLKDFPLPNATHLTTFLKGIGFNFMSYIAGTALRDSVTDIVNTASKEPKSINLEPHNEMSYTNNWPKLILFYCDEAAPINTGGETVITDVRDIRKQLDPDVVDKFEELGILYQRRIAGKSSNLAWYTTWQEVMKTDSKKEAEEYLSNHGYTHRWKEDGTLVTQIKLPATRKHWRTGEKVWFNQAHLNHGSYFKVHPEWLSYQLPDDQYPLHTFYGDGSVITDDVIQHLRDVTWSVSVGWQMQQGDLLILDNMLVQHGRLSFTEKRRLLTSLVSMD